MEDYEDAGNGARRSSSTHRRYDRSNLIRSRSLENVRSRTDAIDEYNYNPGYYDYESPAAGSLQYNNELYYKTPDGRLVRINKPNSKAKYRQQSSHDTDRRLRDSRDRHASPSAYDSVYMSDYAAGKLNNAKRNASKKNQVHFADKVAYNADDSLASIDNVRIPHGAVTIVRGVHGELVYYDANGKIIDIKRGPSSHGVRKYNNSSVTRTKFDDYSNSSFDGNTFIDSGYNTTMNASLLRSQRQTPVPSSIYYPQSHQNELLTAATLDHPSHHNVLSSTVRDTSLLNGVTNNNIPYMMTHTSGDRHHHHHRSNVTSAVNAVNNNSHPNRIHVSSTTTATPPSVHRTIPAPLYTQSVIIPQHQQQPQTRPPSSLLQPYPLTTVDQNTLMNSASYNINPNVVQTQRVTQSQLLKPAKPTNSSTQYYTTTVQQQPISTLNGVSVMGPTR